jgi:hypothetical protein
MLSETPIFTTLDSSELGGNLEASRILDHSQAQSGFRSSRQLPLCRVTIMRERLLGRSEGALNRGFEMGREARLQHPRPLCVPAGINSGLLK